MTSSISSLLTDSPKLQADEVHLWLCARDAVVDSAFFCRQILSLYADPPAGDWQFERFGEGKPRLQQGQAELDFNLSHSGEFLVCAVTAGHPVGVDIEFEKPARDVMRLASRFFNEAEVAALQACEPSRQRACFYDLWTLKEATVKSQGEALSPQLKELCFSLDYTTAGPAAICPRFGQPEAVFTLFEPAPHYRLALCLPGPTASQPVLRCFHWLGAGDGREEQLTLLAHS